MNRPMRVKLLYHVKYVIEQHAYGYFNRERDIYISLECSLNVNTNVNSNMYFEKFKVKDRHSLIIQSIL